MMKKKIFTEDEAEKLFGQAKKCIDSFAGAADTVKEKIYDLIKNEAYKYLSYKTEQDMFKELFKGCNKHRSTLNDYKICALVEIELNIGQGRMSTDALVALYEGTRKEDWVSIYDSAREGLDDRKFPTKQMILKAKQQLIAMHESDSDLESGDSDEEDEEDLDVHDQLDGGVSDEAGEPDELEDFEDNSNTEDESGKTLLGDKLTNTLERVSLYPVAKKKKILQIINPVTNPGKDTIFLLRHLNDDQFEEFKESIKRACSTK